MIRNVRSDDLETVSEWAFSTRNNGLDPKIATYPHLHVVAVELDGKTKMFLPMHTALVIQSACVAPDITPREYIEALLECKAYTEALARRNELPEIYTSSSHKPMIKTLSRHGYQPVVGTALLKKI